MIPSITGATGNKTFDVFLLKGFVAPAGCGLGRFRKVALYLFMNSWDHKVCSDIKKIQCISLEDCFRQNIYLFLSHCFALLLALLGLLFVKYLRCLPLFSNLYMVI